jgi:adenylate cyclase
MVQAWSTAPPKAPPLALIFTDIENSTDLWERLPEAMGRALAAHNSIIRRLIRQHAYEVKDGGHFVFPAASSLNPSNIVFQISISLCQ